MSVEQHQGVQWEHSMEHPQQGRLTCVGTTGMQCPPSPWCCEIKLRTQTLKGSLELVSNVKKTRDQRWKESVRLCGSARVPPAFMTPTVTAFQSAKEGGGPRTPGGEAACFMLSLWTCLGPSLCGEEGGSPAQRGGRPPGKGQGLLGKAKACFQGANCIYS